MDHEEREKICCLEPVASRVRRGIAIETFKISKGTSGVRSDILSPLSHTHNTRGIAVGNFAHEKPRRDVRKFSFAATAPVIWDGVEADAKAAATVNAFKNCYDRKAQGHGTRSRLL